MFIDIHLHSTQRGDGPHRGNGETYATPEQLIALFDERGIDKAVLLPSIGVECAHHQLSVDGALDIAARHPDRFIPFCNVDPRMLTNSPEADFAPMLDFYKAQGCRGVGELTANLPFDDPRCWNLFGHVEAAGLPLTFHVATRVGGTYGLVDDLGLPRLERTLGEFPELTFLGHSQAFWSEIGGDVTDATRGGYPDGPVAEGGRVVALMRACPNLCGDLSANSGFNAVSRDPAFGYRFCEEFQDRLFFGTDLCSLTTPTPLVGFLTDAVAGGHISREAFEKIAWRNAARLLGLADAGDSKQS
ncbi:MAG: amidohydrolase family protein [Planctomycetota bacterium]